MLAKINITEHILAIFLIKIINILTKTIKYKESLNINFLKTECPIWLKFENLMCFSLCNGPILISNRATSFCLLIQPPLLIFVIKRR